MDNEPNKPIAAEELTEKELEDVVGGARLIQNVVNFHYKTFLDKEIDIKIDS